MKNTPSQTGNLYTIAAPSGTGKTTLVKTLVDSLSDITVSVSHTTRPRRPAEVDGVNYYFTEMAEFRRMIERQEFIEYATVFNNFYGTSRKWVEDTLARGIDVILEIDWQGCQQIKKIFPQCISIFILPPSLEALSERLVCRNQDKPEIIEQRIADAQETIFHIPEFDFMVVNDQFETAVQELKTIVEAGRLSQSRQAAKFAKLISELETP